jgi:hypothetical protein
MPVKECKICGKEGDAKEDFYKKSGLVCRTCWNDQTDARKKAVGGKVIDLLEEILAMQHKLEKRINKLENRLSDRVDIIDDDLTKIQRKLKKISIA